MSRPAIASLSHFSLSHITAGFVCILVGYTGAAAIVFQAAAAGGGSPEVIASWLWALGIGMGVSTFALSLYYRHPVIVAWSTSGAALLVTSLPGIPMSEAVGAFLFSSALLTLCGITGLFDRIMKLVPQALAAALLAGILLRFSLNVFPAMETNFALVGAMLAAFLLGKFWLPRYVIPLAFAVGLAVALAQGTIGEIDTGGGLTSPVLTMPEFRLSTLIGVGLPLFVVTMASQNVPGIAALRAHGYDTPTSPLIAWTGVTGLILGVFGGFAFNMSAITASICMGSDADPDPARRYLAGLWAAFFYILTGLFAATVTSFFVTFPAEMVMAIAGLALMTTVANSLKTALEHDGERDAAMLTFVITASGVTLFSIGSAFWGLVAGLATHALLRRRMAPAVN